MALGQRDESLAADWVRFRDLTTSGKSDEAFRRAEQTIAQSPDPFEVAQAHLELGSAYYAERDWDALLPVVKQIEETLPAASHPRLVGQYHTLTGVIAYDRRSYGIALLHLVEAERALARMDEFSRAAVDAWHDLASVYSKLGYHAWALEAAYRGQSVCADAGLPRAVGTAVIPFVQSAVHLDQ